MSNQSKGSLESGSVINPRHFIYLDRSRLFSYTAQLSDGLPQLRRLLESASRKAVSSDIEQSREITEETSYDGEVSLGPRAVIGTAAGKRGSKTAKKRGFKDSGLIDTQESLTALLEDKVEHDNLYLLLEQDLTDAGLLHEVEQGLLLDRHLPLVKIKGIARFFDWATVLKLMEKPDDVWGAFDENTRRSWGNKNNLKTLSRVVQMFSIGPLTVQMQVEEQNVVASLNPDHLCMSLEQLRAAYVMPGDVEITLVGFAPKRPAKKAVFPGIAGQMNMAEVWTAFVGEVDLVIDPLAVYGEAIN